MAMPKMIFPIDIKRKRERKTAPTKCINSLTGNTQLIERTEETIEPGRYIRKIVHKHTHTHNDTAYK